jgi:hypothetical protein
MRGVQATAIAFGIWLLLLPQLPAAAQAPTADADSSSEDRGLQIQWTPVPGARAYLFEVRDGKKAAILKRTVPAPRILLRLPEGAYEMRSRAVDRFRRPTPWTEWTPLRIRYAVPPEIDSVSPQNFKLPAAPGAGQARSLELRGKHFVRESEIHLYVDARPVPVSAAEFVDEGTLRFYLPPNAPEGEYDLTVVNPGDIRIRRTAAFRVQRDGGLPEFAAEPGENREDSRAELPSELASPGFQFSSLIPGLPDFLGGRYGRGSLWLSAFLGASAAAFGGYQSAISVASSADNNPLYPSFSNPIYLYGLLTFNANDLLLPYVVSTGQISDSARSRYTTGRANYAYFGGAALLVFLTHVALYAFDGPELPAYEPGDAQLEIQVGPGDTHRGPTEIGPGAPTAIDSSVRVSFTLFF